MISKIKKEFGKIFGFESQGKNSKKRPLEEESEDEEREREGGGEGERESVRKRARTTGGSVSSVPSNTSYRDGVRVIVEGMSGLFDWMYTLLSPRKREPPVQLYEAEPKIRMKELERDGENERGRDGVKEGERDLILCPEAYVRGEKKFDLHKKIRSQETRTRKFFRPEEDDEIQFIASVKKDKQTHTLTNIQTNALTHIQTDALTHIQTDNGSDASEFVARKPSPIPFSLSHSLSLSAAPPLPLRERERDKSLLLGAGGWPRSLSRPGGIRKRKEDIVSRNPLKIRSARSSRSCVHQSFRFEDKMRYLQLLQQFTSACVLPTHAHSSSPSPIMRTRLDATQTRRTRAYIESEGNAYMESESKTPFLSQTLPLSPLGVRNLGEMEQRATKKANSTPLLVDLEKEGKEGGTGEKGATVVEEEERDSDCDSIVVLCQKSATTNNNDNNSKMQQGLSASYTPPDILADIKEKYNKKSLELERQFTQAEKLAVAAAHRRRRDLELNESVTRALRTLDLTHTARRLKVLEEPPEERLEEGEKLPELTPEMEEVVDSAITYTSTHALVQRFNIQIYAHDIRTLTGLNWLNDEIINFYMNLIVERGDAHGHMSTQQQKTYMAVYAFNTFFYPKLIKNGYSAVRRWTKKIDVFKYEVVLIPIHLGMHWCLATVDLNRKRISYYDSMLGNNDRCLQTLLSYIESEHLDKKKSAYDTSDWTLTHMKDIPQQMNGSDCGVFTCVFAEFVSREAAFVFGQEHMPYFRRRMIYEILTCKLL